MPNLINKILKKISINRRQLMLATIVVFGLLILFLLHDAKYQVAEAPVIEKSAVIEGLVMEESEPVKLTIPKIGLVSNFESPLGLQDNGEIQVPVGYDTVGYYKFGPTPGELGPAVILGHVDSVEGPAVFFSLGQLAVGDEIEIEREDGSVAIFAVTALERHAQAGFPTKKVYSDINHAGLRLITCTGIYDRNSLRYTHNLIVFAKLIETAENNSQI